MRKNVVSKTTSQVFQVFSNCLQQTDWPLFVTTVFFQNVPKVMTKSKHFTSIAIPS